jgi:hypothetical protein
MHRDAQEYIELSSTVMLLTLPLVIAIGWYVGSPWSLVLGWFIGGVGTMAWYARKFHTLGCRRDEIFRMRNDGTHD